MLPLLIILFAAALLVYALFGFVFALARLLWILAPSACLIVVALFIVGLFLNIGK